MLEIGRKLEDFSYMLSAAAALDLVSGNALVSSGIFLLWFWLCKLEYGKHKGKVLLGWNLSVEEARLACIGEDDGHYIIYGSQNPDIMKTDNLRKSSALKLDVRQIKFH